MADFQATIEKLLLSDTGDLVELAKIAGKDPKTFYIDADFKWCDLTGQNLSQIDTRYSEFSHAKLSKLELALWEVRKRIHIHRLDNNWADYAASNVALGAILGIFAERTTGDDGLVFIEESISAFRSALTIRTKDQYPMEWAQIQLKLAQSLYFHAGRIRGRTGANLYTYSVAAYREALTVYTNSKHLAKTVSTQNSLAKALRDHSNCTSNLDIRNRLRREALNAFRTTVTTNEKDQEPVQWAENQTEIAIVLRQLASQTHGEDGAYLYRDAVIAYREALTVYKKNSNAERWAQVQFNIASSLADQAARSQDKTVSSLYENAVISCHAALSVQTYSKFPFQWAENKNKLAEIEFSRAMHKTTQSPRPHLKLALGYLDEVLSIFDSENGDLTHSLSTHLRKKIVKALKPDD